MAAAMKFIILALLVVCAIHAVQGSEAASGTALQVVSADASLSCVISRDITSSTGDLVDFRTQNLCCPLTLPDCLQAVLTNSTVEAVTEAGH